MLEESEKVPPEWKLQEQGNARSHTEGLGGHVARYLSLCPTKATRSSLSIFLPVGFPPHLFRVPFRSASSSERVIFIHYLSPSPIYVWSPVNPLPGWERWTETGCVVGGLVGNPVLSPQYPLFPVNPDFPTLWTVHNQHQSALGSTDRDINRSRSELLARHGGIDRIAMAMVHLVDLLDPRGSLTGRQTFFALCMCFPDYKHRRRSFGSLAGCSRRCRGCCVSGSLSKRNNGPTVLLQVHITILGLSITSVVTIRYSDLNRVPFSTVNPPLHFIEPYLPYFKGCYGILIEDERLRWFNTEISALTSFWWYSSVFIRLHTLEIPLDGSRRMYCIRFDGVLLGIRLVVVKIGGPSGPHIRCLSLPPFAQHQSSAIPFPVTLISGHLKGEESSRVGRAIVLRRHRPDWGQVYALALLYAFLVAPHAYRSTSICSLRCDFGAATSHNLGSPVPSLFGTSGVQTLSLRFYLYRTTTWTMSGCTWCQVFDVDVLPLYSLLGLFHVSTRIKAYNIRFDLDFRYGTPNIAFRRNGSHLEVCLPHLAYEAVSGPTFGARIFSNERRDTCLRWWQQRRLEGYIHRVDSFFRSTAIVSSRWTLPGLRPSRTLATGVDTWCGDLPVDFGQVFREKVVQTGNR
ncbi:hypothetical protein NMY22_g18292 [Coprinellus aureogranulatus]|nr:hypothetical protein NMY22_g18292 [Coprinellus aureogranulatus]